jgi:hypothetical protein
MAQQPNIEPDGQHDPRATLQPDVVRPWRPSDRPGVISTPDQMPHGEGFGNPGPDTGWAFRLIAADDIPGRSDGLVKVLGALMGARASSFGRAPTREDLEVAKILCGLGDGLPLHLAERTERWVEATSHERPPGRSALAEVGENLRLKPAEVRLRVSRPE